MGIRRKFLSKEQILSAQSKTLSNRAASKFLHVSYHHYRKYAKMYGIFEQHLNPSGKGIPKFLKGGGKIPAMINIIEGRISPSSFDPNKLKRGLIDQGYLLEECSICSFKERRVIDYKIPLLLNFKDQNVNNYGLDNIELLCYNHYFLYIADVLSLKEENQIETYTENYKTTDRLNWELDPYHLERLKELGLVDNEEKDDNNKYISRF